MTTKMKFTAFCVILFVLAITLFTENCEAAGSIPYGIKRREAKRYLKEKQNTKVGRQRCIIVKIFGFLELRDDPFFLGQYSVKSSFFTFPVHSLDNLSAGKLFAIAWFDSAILFTISSTLHPPPP